MHKVKKVTTLFYYIRKKLSYVIAESLRASFLIFSRVRAYAMWGLRRKPFHRGFFF